MGYIRSHNEDLVPVLIQFDCRVFAFGSFHITEESVRVTTNDQVNALGFLRQFDVLIVANVGQSNDPGNVFLCLDEVNGSLESCYRVLKMSSRTRVRDMSGGCGSHRKHSKAVVFENNVRNQGIAKGFIVRMNVAGGDWECKVFDLIRTNQSAPIVYPISRRYAYECSENIITGVKLMVSDRHGVKTKLVESIRDFFAPIETVEQCALQSKLIYLVL